MSRQTDESKAAVLGVLGWVARMVEQTSCPLSSTTGVSSHIIYPALLQDSLLGTEVHRADIVSDDSAGGFFRLLPSLLSPVHLEQKGDAMCWFSKPSLLPFMNCRLPLTRGRA